MTITRSPTQQRQTISGVGVSPGYAIGQAYFVDRRKLKVPQVHLGPDAVESELERFNRALDVSEKQIQDLKNKLKAKW